MEGVCIAGLLSSGSTRDQQAKGSARLEENLRGASQSDDMCKEKFSFESIKLTVRCGASSWCDTERPDGEIGCRIGYVRCESPSTVLPVNAVGVRSLAKARDEVTVP